MYDTVSINTTKIRDIHAVWLRSTSWNHKWWKEVVVNWFFSIF